MILQRIPYMKGNTEKKQAANFCLVAIAVLVFLASTLRSNSLTELDFTKEFDLESLFVNGMDLSQRKVYAGNYEWMNVEGERFLRFKDIIWPLGARLKTSHEVGDHTLTIEISADMRQEPQKMLYFSLALTSKELPDRFAASTPFRKGLDSGIEVSGYAAAVQSANRILWRKDGMDYLYEAPRPPFNFVSKEGRAGSWFTWRLIYHHPDKTLSLFIDDEPQPRAVQHLVDLDGVTLHNVYFGIRSTQSWGDCRRVTVRINEK